jgi:hypothetical protein
MILVAGGVLDPVRYLGGASYPDERLVFAGLMLLLASVSPRVFQARRALVGGGAIAILLALHVVEYSRASGHLETIRVATETAIPEDLATLSVTVWDERVGGACDSDSGFSFGTPTLMWFDLGRLAESGPTGALVMDTSIVRYRLRQDAVLRHWTKVVESDELRAKLGISARWKLIPKVLVFGCRDHVVAAREQLGRTYVTALEGEWFAVLRGPRIRDRQFLLED